MAVNQEDRGIGEHPRHIKRRLLDCLEFSPAVMLHGPRQCGKTTLVKQLLKPLNYKYFSMDDENTLAYAASDPVGFVNGLPERAVIDEAQLAPGIFRSLKASIDRNRIPGRFLLTGSSHMLLVPKLTDSLAGRILFLRMHPLSRCELAGSDAGFLDSVFAGSFGLEPYEILGDELIRMVAVGGYPPAVAAESERRRRDWHRSNLESVTLRDMDELFRIDRPELLGRMVRLAARQTSGLFNAAGMGVKCEVSQQTAARYIGLLERMFLLERLQPWHSDLAKREVKAPKIHLEDSGMACSLLKLDAAALKADRAVFGRLLETFVYRELQRQASWSDMDLSFHHFRDRDNVEVDIVVEGENLAVAGIEVKAGSTARKSDLRGLRQLARAAGEKFVAGVVLYDGPGCVGFGDRLFAVPIRRLWEAPAAHL